MNLLKLYKVRILRLANFSSVAFNGLESFTGGLDLDFSSSNNHFVPLALLWIEG